MKPASPRAPRLAALTLSCLPAVFLPVTATGAECTQSASLVWPAPGGQLRALVQEQACATATGAAAAVTVILAPPGSGAGTRVLAIAVPRSRSEWPLPRWTDAGRLELWVPNLANVLAQEAVAGEVQVTLHRCNDNPADRQALADHEAARQQWMRDTTAWVKRRKEAPGTEGARPVRPEAPQVPPGRCDAAAFPPPAPATELH